MPRRSPQPNRERRAQAVRLRAEGLTFEQIGAELGVTRARAHQIVRAELEAVRVDDVNELRAVAQERLELIWRAAYPLAQKGSAPHAIVCLRALERSARMNGLDTPADVALGVVYQTEFDKVVAALTRPVVAEPTYVSGTESGRISPRINREHVGTVAGYTDTSPAVLAAPAGADRIEP